MPTVTNCGLPFLEKAQFVTALGIEIWIQKSPPIVCGDFWICIW